MKGSDNVKKTFYKPIEINRGRIQYPEEKYLKVCPFNFTKNTQDVCNHCNKYNYCEVANPRRLK